jgi:hypothetical protein
MCYTGGPRCDGGAIKAVNSAKEKFEKNPTDENKAALEKANQEYLTSPVGIKSVRDAGKTDEADKLQRRREVLIAQSQERTEAELLTNPTTNPNTLHRAALNGHYHAKVAVANNPNASLRTLKHIMETEEEDDFRFAIARHPKATEEMVTWASEHRSMYAKNLAMDNPNISQDAIKEIRRSARADWQENSEEGKTVSPMQSYHLNRAKEAGATWKRSRALLEVPSGANGKKYQEIASDSIPRESEYKQYYADTDAKHFHDKEKPGSKFTDARVKNLNDVAALTAYQRGSLEGDDRETLIKYGANPAAFNDNFRYLIVKTPGKLGAQDISTFPANTKFRIEKTKSGASCSVVADVKSQASTNFGVVIMGNPKGSGKDIVITAHPGMPASRSGEGTFDSYEGKSLSANHIREIAGTDNINVNTRLI